MAYNRPWGVWWDSVWEGDHITHIVVQTDHPSYSKLDYIYKFPIKDCEDEFGYVDTWVEKCFRPFESDVISGRISIHKLIKELKNE